MACWGPLFEPQQWWGCGHFKPGQVIGDPDGIRLPASRRYTLARLRGTLAPSLAEGLCPTWSPGPAGASQPLGHIPSLVAEKIAVPAPPSQHQGLPYPFPLQAVDGEFTL